MVVWISETQIPRLLQLGRECSSGAERALAAFIVERILFYFFLFFYMQIKLQDYCGLSSLLTSAVSLLSDSTWPLFPALGTGQEIQLWFLLPVTFCTAPGGAEQMFPAWWGQGALCTQQVQEELAPVKQELGNDLIEFATDEPVLVKAEFPGGYTVVWHWEPALNLNPSY